MPAREGKEINQAELSRWCREARRIANEVNLVEVAMLPHRRRLAELNTELVTLSNTIKVADIDTVGNRTKGE